MKTPGESGRKARWAPLFSLADDARRGSVSARAIFSSPWLLGFQYTFRMQQKRGPSPQPPPSLRDAAEAFHRSAPCSQQQVYRHFM